MRAGMALRRPRLSRFDERDDAAARSVAPHVIAERALQEHRARAAPAEFPREGKLT